MKNRIKRILPAVLAALLLNGVCAFAAPAYNDVSESDWFYGDVMKATWLGLFEGADGAFLPSSPLSRAQMATVLCRMAGEVGDHRKGSEIYSDVPAGCWFDDAVGIVTGLKIAEGTGNGCFSPVSLITREQFAVMLYNFSVMNGLEGENAGESSGFEDSAQISGWAKDAMDWAVSSGVFRGSGTKLFPGRPITRAEAATSLVRWSELED